MSYKKLFCSILSILFVTLLFSQEEITNPEISSTETSEFVEETFYYEPVESIEKASGDNFFTKLFATTVPFKEYDNFEVYYKNTLKKIKLGDAVFAVFDKEDFAGFGVQMTACYYYTFMDRATRNKLIAAGNHYLNDFEEKKLVRKSNKTYRAYGKSKVKVRFGSLKNKANNTSDPVAYFGYDFVEKSPYFHITVLNAKNDRYEGGVSSYPKESDAYNIYLTKAQLRTLMQLLSNENVDRYVSVPVEKKSDKKNINPVVSGDEY